MSKFNTLDNIDVAGKTVMLRADINVPVDENFNVTNTARIDRTVPTIKELQEKGAKVVVISHFGRPKGERKSEFSLSHIAPALQKALGSTVTFIDDCIGTKVANAVAKMSDNEVLLLENLRFYKEETEGDVDFARNLVDVCDVYVSDAFSTAHRAHASMKAAVELKPSAAGRLMQIECESLDSVLSAPVKPVAAVVGGAKVSSKLELLNNLVKKVDVLVISGGMAHTFLKATGVDTINTDNSLVQMDMLDTAREILETAKTAGCEVILPKDVVASKDFKAHAEHMTVALDSIPATGYELLDVGEKSIENITSKIANCKTLLWNGPLGVFELEPFDKATNKVAQFAAELTKKGELKTVAGGGDTVSALANAGVDTIFSYVSTAGGAFLEWLEGKELPGVKVLEK